MISVIMPIYNGEKYIECALDSILDQTFKDFELICINDCSDDNTRLILTKYQVSDSRIIVYDNSTRMGAAYSRNLGLEKASGEYLLFLDGDDYFECDMFEKMYCNAIENDLDISLCEFCVSPSEYIKENKLVNRSSEFNNNYVRSVFALNNINIIDPAVWCNAPWNKMYKASFINSNEIYFQDLESSNDVYFVEMALILACRVKYIEDNKAMVHQRVHFENSRISNYRSPYCIYEAFFYIINSLKNRYSCNQKSVYEYILLKFYFLFVQSINRGQDEIESEKFYNAILVGINSQLLKSFRNDYLKIDNVLNLYYNFENKTFESKWFKKFSIVPEILYRKKKSFMMYFSRGRRIIVWGIGKNGLLLLDFLRMENIIVNELIDSDKDKVGKEINSLIIKNVNEIEISDYDLVIVTSPIIYTFALEKKGNSTAEILDFCTFLSLDH